ncbi:MAG: bifunctional diaminohydroxyphosphoribosylaminopyrimidine deaminase/5-amino-6-(5-phosphoribosylamino)uracil reductase RibD [Pseudomonadales bacterium]|nr:bifunctional diaminohydroxyphosphoribosylaminopyrimidine deaminase/5-amino-6-(5-phosphoribosylamino)uracil reductase RibD [Pseudomonadales bacterium]
MAIDASFTQRDRQLMQAALELAERGRYTTMPNPRVGCIIAQGDHVHGRGAHLRAGQQHAEVLALAEAGDNARGATAYVTLEPCSFAGRTGPCTEALINAQVARVIYALEDPNPQVAGRGGDALRSAGIAVAAGLLEDQAQEINRGFFKRMRQALPFVLAKTAVSIDGRTALADGSSQWITGPAARQRVQEMRAQSCALVTGVGTVLQDNPSLTVRTQQLGEDIGRQPALVIVDSQLRTPPDAKVIGESLLSGREVLMACASSADAGRIAAFTGLGVEVQQFSHQANASDDRVNLAGLLKALAQRQYNEVLLEAGAGLLGSFIAQGLVDELAVFVAPKLLGATAMPLAKLDIESMQDAVNFSLIEASPIGEDRLMRYRPAGNR